MDKHIEHIERVDAVRKFVWVLWGITKVLTIGYFLR
jgi:hypothetical protein